MFVCLFVFPPYIVVNFCEDNAAIELQVQKKIFLIFLI